MCMLSWPHCVCLWAIWFVRATGGLDESNRTCAATFSVMAVAHSAQEGVGLGRRRRRVVLLWQCGAARCLAVGASDGCCRCFGEGIDGRIVLPTRKRLGRKPLGSGLSKRGATHRATAIWLPARSKMPQCRCDAGLGLGVILAPAALLWRQNRQHKRDLHTKLVLDTTPCGVMCPSNIQVSAGGVVVLAACSSPDAGALVVRACGWGWF